MDKGVFEKAGPLLVIGTVFVLCAGAFWMFLSHEPNRVQRGADDKKVVTGPGDPRNPTSLPLPPGVPGVNPGPQNPQPPAPADPNPSTSNPYANPDTAPEAGPPVFEQSNMDGPPPDSTYYPGPDPAQIDPNTPDGPPPDDAYYPGPPPVEPVPGQPDGPPMGGPDDPTQGPPQTDPNQPQPK